MKDWEALHSELINRLSAEQKSNYYDNLNKAEHLATSYTYKGNEWRLVYPQGEPPKYALDLLYSKLQLLGSSYRGFCRAFLFKAITYYKIERFIDLPDRIKESSVLAYIALTTEELPDIKTTLTQRLERAFMPQYLWRKQNAKKEERDPRKRSIRVIKSRFGKNSNNGSGRKIPQPISF